MSTGRREGRIEGERRRIVVATDGEPGHDGEKEKEE